MAAEIVDDQLGFEGLLERTATNDRSHERFLYTMLMLVDDV